MWSLSGPPSHSGFTWEAHLLWSWRGRRKGCGTEDSWPVLIRSPELAMQALWMFPSLRTHRDLAPDTVQASDALVALDALVTSVTLGR